MDCPTNNIDAKQEYYKNELNRLDEYAQKRIDFVRYYRSGVTNLDEGLFLRNQNYLHQYMDSFSFERDDAFSTVGDFRTDLSNFPRDFYEMRIRNDQMPFIDKLKNLLKKRMDNPKKPYKD